MPPITTNTVAEQLRGATLLAIEATRNVTDLVEAMHHTIGAGPALLGRPLEATTKFLTAPAYGAIRGVTGVVGASLDRALRALAPLLDQSGAERGALLAVLNGVLGDYLAETNNPLAINMRLCSQRAGLALTPAALASAFPEGDRLLVLVHGSCLDEGSWQRKHHDHGKALAADLGYVPLYLRYNTGLHVSTNGRAFASMLEQLVRAWPRPVEEISLLGHSMGGLVSRSACAVGEAEDHLWRRQLRALVTMSTPHHGAPLERWGNWVDTALTVSRYSAPFARLGRLRSGGVTDLRFGNVLDGDWAGQDRFTRRGDHRLPLPLPRDVQCFAIAASSNQKTGDKQSGDGLVSVDSALGRHEDPARTLGFVAARQFIAQGTTHLSVLGSQEVYAQLKTWLSAP